MGGSIWSRPENNNPEGNGREDVPVHDDTINILLVGSIGSGKSSTGNTLLHLKREHFEVSGNDTSTTHECQAEYWRFEEKRIKIVDMPGLDSESSKHDIEEHVFEAAMNALVDTPGGYDAIVIVIKHGTKSRTTNFTIEQLKKMFGNDVLRQYGILVVTHGDDFRRQKEENQSFKMYCSNQKGQIHELWDECNHRAVSIDNVTEDPEEKKAQRKEFFDAVKEITRNARRYKLERFGALWKKYNAEMLKKANQQILIESYTKTIRLAMHDLGDIDVDNSTSKDQLPVIWETVEHVRRNVLLGAQNETRSKLLNLIDSLGKAVQMKRELIDMINKCRASTADRDSTMEMINSEHDKNIFMTKWNEEHGGIPHEIKDKRETMKDTESALDNEYKTYLKELTAKMKVGKSWWTQFKQLFGRSP